ncbi:MAG: metallophosphoesterase [Candidatus Sumerlaeia bacterium]|nr:metallophosphoesterase [Candidatus Sumerlaeia bacterium]
MPTAAALAAGALAATGAAGLLVRVQNRTLCHFRESYLKKAVALGTMPGAAVVGVLAARAFDRDPGPWTAVALASLMAAGLAALWSTAGQLRLERLDARRRQVSPRHWPADHAAAEGLKPAERALLRALRPVNRPTALDVVRYRLPLDDLPAGFEGYRIVWLTDPHLHRTLPWAYYRHAVATAMSLRPDLVLLGGDYITRAAFIPRIAEMLDGLSAPDGVLAIRGNHDFWTDPAAVEAQLALAGARLLKNDLCEVRRPDGVLRIAGIEAPYLPLGPWRRARLAERGRPHLALVHTPDAFPLAASLGAQAALAGHTHGGQVRLPFFGTTLSGQGLGPGFSRGSARLGGTRTLVSHGVGAFVPLRFRCHPEVHLLLLARRGQLADRLAGEGGHPADGD